MGIFINKYIKPYIISKMIKITPNLEALDYDEIVELLHKVINSDFAMYFNVGVGKYLVSTLEEKSEILYDISHSIPYYSEDKKLILVRANINEYGNKTYAIENLLSTADMWRDTEDFDD